jgi:hypothetical protein
MATPSKTGKNLIEYNVKNGVYALDGSTSTVSPLGYLASMTLDSNISTKEIYGDGSLVLSVITDKGKTGTLEMTARDYDFEEALGFVKELSNGLGELQVVENKTLSIGYECYVTGADGVTKTKKIWLLGVNVSPASDSLSQNTDTTNEATASYGLTVKGVNLQDSTGTGDYTDTNGNTYKVWKLTSMPTDTGYSTFLDSVPTPKAAT